MSSLSGSPAPHSASIADPARQSQSGLIGATWLLALLAALVALLFVRQAVIEVWQTGRYYDTDDAMRMVQVRDLLAGQGWYDLVVHRLNPPDGMLSHWSRIVDIPLAALVLFFSLFTDRNQAEILTRLAFPLLMHVGYFAAVLALARRLSGDIGVVTAFFLAIFALTTNIQFLPGRIDHHAPQILLLVSIAWMTVRLLGDGDRRAAWWLGGLIAISFAISIENMPFIAALLAVIAIAWACGQAPVQRALQPLGFSLLLFVPAAFAATVPPARYFDAIADAFGIAHVVLLMLGGAAALAAGSVDIQTSRRRWCLLAAFGAACVAIVVIAFPYVLRDPLTTVDPLVRRLWLSRVREARPLLPLLLANPLDWFYYVTPLIGAMIAAGIAIRTHAGAKRWPWIAIAVLLVLGTLGTFWQIRVITSILPFVAITGAWAVSAFSAHQTRTGGRAVALKAVLLGTLFSGFAWNMAAYPLWPSNAASNTTSNQASDPAAPQVDDADACFVSSSYVALRNLPPQLTLATIDLGPHVLAHSAHPVIAASYHRNNRGNHLLIEAMISDPAIARALIEGAGAKLLAFCPAGPEFKGYIKEAPQGFAAALRDGTPDWLTPVGDQTGPIRIMAVR